MQVRSDLLVINAHRNLKNVGIVQSKSARRLSSGNRIDTAADDAAGMAISEKMQAQIRGLKQAQANTEDGINLCKTMDGAMGEITNIMIRQRELIIQGLNDTNSDEDKAVIKDELDELSGEIDGIANRAEFNTVPLLHNPEPVVPVKKIMPADVVIALDVSGSMGGELTDVKNSLSDLFANMPEGSRVGFVIYSDTLTIPSESNIVIPLSGDVDQLQAEINKVTLMGGGDEAEAGLEGLTDAIDMLSGNPNKYKKIIYITDAYAHTSSTGYSSHSIAEINGRMKSNGIEFHGCGPTGGTGLTQLQQLEAGTEGGIYDYSDLSGLRDGTFTATEEVIVYEPAPIPPLVIQCGANTGQEAYIDRYDCTVNGIYDGIFYTNIELPSESGKKSAYLTQLDVKPWEVGLASLIAIDRAMDKVNSHRANVGAQQTGLEFTDNYLGVAFTDLENANSRIRDADMAKEMMAYTKSAVISNASASLLAQLNRSREVALQLLQ